MLRREAVERAPLGVAILVAVLAGVLLARALEKRTAEPPPGPAPAAALTAAGLRLAKPAGWTSTTPNPQLPSIRFIGSTGAAHAMFPARLVAGWVPATSPTLLPADLVRRVLKPLRRERVRLVGGLAAYRYTGLADPDAREVLEVLVTPTTRGVATVACSAEPAVSALLTECARSARTLVVEDGVPIALGADAAFRQRLPGVVRALDQTRVTERRRLARVRLPAGQAAAARALSSAYRQASAVLGGLAPPAPAWPGRLVRMLRSTATAYGRLADALARRTDVARARAAVIASETRAVRLLRLSD